MSAPASDWTAEARAAGWHREGECDPCALDHIGDDSVEDPTSVLARWHDTEGHRHAFRFCDIEPCKSVAYAMRGIYG